MVNFNCMVGFCFTFLVHFCSSSQTTFTVTDRVLGNSASSFDNIITAAVASANSGNDVTVYFNVAPDACGNTLCYIDSDIPYVTPTNGSILLIASTANTNPQGFEYESSCALPKVFYSTGGMTGGKVKVQNLSFKIITSSNYCVSRGYFELKKDLKAGYVNALQGRVKFTFDEEYKMETNKFLPYKLYDDNHTLLAESSITGVTTGGAQAMPYNFDDNRYILNLAVIAGAIAGKYYLLEVKTSTGEKRYLRILYK